MRGPAIHLCRRSGCRKVATQPTGSQERRIAISNTDPHGGGVHWFTVCFEITKTH
jgi:hypothetical protein